MAFIGKKPTAAPLTSSDVADGIITNAKLAQDIISADTALGAEPADTDEFLVSDAGVLKRMDYSYIKGGGGKILQIVPVVWKTAFSSTVSNGTFATITDATASITPSSTSSKIWFNAMITTGCQTYAPWFKIQKGGSDIAGALGQSEGSRTVMTAMSVGGTSDNAELQSTYISYVDSPSSTSSLTYTIVGGGRAAGTWTVNYPYDNNDYNYNGHSISTITLLEIDGS